MKIKFEKTRFFWLYFVFSALLIVLGIFLLPVWSEANVFFKNWSSESIDIILAILVVLYVVFYLLKNVKKDNPKKGLKVLKIIEICLLFLLSIFCVLEQFKVTNFIGPCFVLGCILYLRGIIFGVRAYLYTHKKSENYSIFNLIFTFIALTFGIVLMIHPFYGNAFMWFISSLLLAISIVLLVVGFITIPKKETKIGVIE